MNTERLLPAALLGLALTLAACGPAASVPSAAPPAAARATPRPLARDVTPEEARTLAASGAFVLDVREPSEWEEFHAANTTLIPLGQLEQRLSEVPRDREVVVICRSGNRSTTGRDILAKAGYGSVTSMTGGLLAWRAKGFPTLSGK